MVKVITVNSGNGGMGKSFFSCNLSYGLKAMEKKVLLVEANLGKRADDIILGIEPDTQYTVKDIFEDNCKVSVAVTSPDDDNLPDFISACHTFIETDFSEGFKKIRNYAINRYDYVIIDTDLNAALGVTDTFIALTDSSFISVRNTGLMVKRALDKGISNVFTVVNNIRPEADFSDFIIEDIIDETFAPLLGIIPYDEFVPASVTDGNLIYKYNTYAGRAIENICKRISGISVPDFEQTSKNSFFARNRLVVK